MRAGIAQSRWVPLVYCDHNARKVLLQNRHSSKELTGKRKEAAL